MSSPKFTCVQLNYFNESKDKSNGVMNRLRYPHIDKLKIDTYYLDPSKSSNQNQTIVFHISPGNSLFLPFNF